MGPKSAQAGEGKSGRSGRRTIASKTSSSKVSSAPLRATKKSPAPFKLYWCETDDHGEDWFIVARDMSTARRFHEDAEGYDRGDADAEMICELPASLQKESKTGWPSRAVLEACGGEVIKGTGADEQPRVVRIRGRVFGEGDVFELARVRLGKTPKN